MREIMSNPAASELGFRYEHDDSSPGPRQLTFKAIHQHAGFSISIAANSSIDMIAIDTSAGEITITSKIDTVDFAFEAAFSLRVGTMTYSADSAKTVALKKLVGGQKKRLVEHLDTLAAQFFDIGLTTTHYQTQPPHPTRPTATGMGSSAAVSAANPTTPTKQFTVKAVAKISPGAFEESIYSQKTEYEFQVQALLNIGFDIETIAKLMRRSDFRGKKGLPAGAPL